MLRLAPNGEAHFYRPDGRPMADAPPLPTVADPPVAALVQRLANQAVTVVAGDTLPDWWGGPVDYGWAIDWLRWLDNPQSVAAAG